MNARSVRDTIIKPKLIDIFGTVIGNFLITKAIAAGIDGKTEQEKLNLMVEAVCSDPKVLGMWGKAQVKKQKQEWLKTLS